jgi:hypothetical protein
MDNKKEWYYFLGFVWADGYLWSNAKTNKHGGYRIILENSTSDLETLMPHFCKIGKFSILKRHRKNSTKEVMRATMYNKSHYEFLMDNGYENKSQKHKIIDIIPMKYRSYFWRGLFDGDGCFGVYARKKRKSVDYRTELSSDFDQDWSKLANQCKKLGISTSIKRKINKTGKVSIFSIGKIKDMIIFGNYLYDGFSKDGIGLKRKFDKFNQIKQSQK